MRRPPGVSTMVANTGRKAVACAFAGMNKSGGGHPGNAGDLDNCALAETLGVVTASRTWRALPGR
jgi:hypothetical protein